LHTRTHRRGLAHASSMDRCTDAQVPCRLRRPAASTENQAQDQQADPGPPANGKACRHGVSANGLTWVALGARFARQGGVCPPPSLHGLHDDDDDDDDDDDVSPSPTHQPTGTTTMFNHDDETTVAEMITSYSGTVTRCPSGRASAPDARHRGKVQLRCVCGHVGEMRYDHLFRRLRRKGMPMQLRCTQCGRVLR
jgi:hypothetical protein